IGALVGDALPSQRVVENLGDLREALDAALTVEVVDPQPAVVILVVAGADADVEASVRDLIDGQGLPRQGRGVPEGAVGRVPSDPWEGGMAEHFDYVIVGAGSAGCVLAARLSEDPAVQVALLEAGAPDTAQEIHIPAGFPKLYKSKWDWDFQTDPEPHLDGRTV